MKIIAVLEKDIMLGGGFNQAINAILQMQRICEGQYEFEIFTTQSDNILYLEKLGLNAHVFADSIVNKLLSRLNTNTWWHIIQTIIKIISPLEKKLLKHRCDLVYFVTSSSTPASLQKLNYITTIWDLCHRDTPIFPEVRFYNEFFKREHYYKKILGPAVLILTDSDTLAARAAFSYGIDPSHFLAMPFAPSPFLDKIQALSKDEVLQKYHLNDRYFYYPAHFWAHKNHVRILEALILLKHNDVKPQIVFSGKDYGNRKYLEEFVSGHNLQEQIIFLGFVPIEDMRGLYEGALAILMPTYFGPTNLPPLEAWSLNKPLIYSVHLAEQAGDAALFIDPDNANDLAEAMKKCYDPTICRQLSEAGKHRLQFFGNQREKAENKLQKKINAFAAQRRCWR